MVYIKIKQRNIINGLNQKKNHFKSMQHAHAFKLELPIIQACLVFHFKIYL